MTELEKLVSDYFKDNAYIASQMYEWCEPQVKVEKKRDRARAKNKLWRKYTADNSKRKK